MLHLLLFIQVNLCFVDIDKNTVQPPEEQPSFPFEKELKEELYQAIVSYKEKMLKETFTDSVISSPKRKVTKKLSTCASEPTLRKNDSFSLNVDKMEILKQSEAWSKISALARKTGVWNNEFEDLNQTETSPKIAQEETTKEKFQELNTMPSRELEELKFNNAVREIFLNRFVHMFVSYEAFVMQTSQDMDSWISNRDTMHNFDKASFLSDQPESYLPFLSPFLETQMFATFIDNKIISQWEESDPNIRVFDDHVRKLKEDMDFDLTSPRSNRYVPCSKLKDTGKYFLVSHIFSQYQKGFQGQLLLLLYHC